MIFRRFTRKRPIATSLMAGGTLVVMAVVGWGVPSGDILDAAWLSLLMVLMLAVPAALLVFVIVLVQRFKARQSENEEGE